MSALRSPYTYFGGKATVAHEIWARFGQVYNYVEPFFGSGSVLLSRPHSPQHEIVNDLDCNIVNFWRSVRKSPDILHSLVDHPISEIDFNTRKKVLRREQKNLRKFLESDPDHCDVKLAGYWVWCVNLAIGGTPSLLTRLRTKPVAQGHGLLGRTQDKLTWLQQLHNRLTNVRVYCGQWDRVLTDAVLWPSTHPELPVGVYLDPPYDHDAVCRELYVEHKDSVAAGAREWAIRHGSNPSLRIALSCYNNVSMPDGWTMYRWSTRGGFANLTGSENLNRNETRNREVIWFSPHCLVPTQPTQLALGVH